MNSLHRERLVKITTVLACMFFLMPCGLPWFWGNLSVYTHSHIVSCLGTTSGVSAPWVLSMYTIFEMVGLFVYGTVLLRFIDIRWIILAGMIITEISIFLTYITVQESYVLLVITLGLTLGMGTGLMYANGLQLIVQHAENDMGFLVSLLQSSFTIGAIAINWGLTWYTNPTNETPDLTLGSMTFFTQKNVLDKVPSMYLVFGVFSLSLHVIGFLLLQFNPFARLFRTASLGNVSNENSEESEEDSDKQDGTYQSLTTDANKDIDHNYSPTEMLKTRSFYIVWFSFFTGYTAFVLVTNYYKSYGELWIHDDHFLTNVGTALIFVSILARLVWGFVLDQLGLKTCLVALTSAIAVLNFVYYFTPMVNRNIFLFTTLLYGGCVGSIYNVHLSALVLLFGKKHASANFSLLTTAPGLFNLIAPLTFDFFLTYFGWFPTYAAASVLLIVNLVLLIVFL